MAHAAEAKAIALPPFDLEYTSGDDGSEPATAAAARGDGRGSADASALAARGTVRIRFLAVMFDEATQEAGAMAQSLIAASSAWGVELGRRFLAGSSVPMPLKFGAARALIEAGVFAPNQPIPIFHQGRSTSIIIVPARHGHPGQPDAGAGRAGGSPGAVGEPGAPRTG